MTLRLGPGLSLPDDIATESVGVLGQRGSGKSNTLVVFAEEMHRAKIPWFAIDPKGDWWGIRSSQDGTGPGLPVPVFGGLHGDLPLEPTAGRYVADLLVDQMLTAVLDVSRMSGGDLAKFLVAFCHRLFDRHQADPHVRCGIFEEAHRYMPQTVLRGDASLKEATVKIPLEGRAFGLGSITASQRSSRLHKDVLTQFSVLVAMRSPAKLDRDAIGGWVEEHAVSKELLATLPELNSGEAWLWSPHYLHRADRVRFRQRATFDSGATPKVGQSARAPRSIADVDLAAIKEAMADTIERAKADDPRELRKRIVQLERQAEAEYRRGHADGVAEGAASAQPEQVKVPVLTEELLLRLEDALSPVAGVLGEIQERLGWEVSDGPGDTIKMRRVIKPAPAQIPPEIIRKAAAKPARPDPPRSSAEPSDGRLPGAQKKLLTVLATYGPRTKRQLALQAGYAASGGGFNNALGRLRAQGYVDPPKGEPMGITDAGRAALGFDFEPLPGGMALLDHWIGQLPAACRKILTALADVWPGSMTKAELANQTGYEASGGGFNNALGRLRTLDLVNRDADLRLTDDFGESIS